ncbi:hypothetical protein SAMN05421767_10624 [Granulicatella balaenopterae]|uniref:Uncharacterized protein n=1 Tax=Granulicatella balaenopterae TaxID=137733 RepID=A0A1H9ILM7_9LACT|nr:hypothetical protein [Granulicatella balaenopterae]SEQ75494.1 hypothetical protein SAMN05421767_10624 [Granulicatella balaenopterae]
MVMNINNMLLKAKNPILWTFDSKCDAFAFEEYTKPNGANAKRKIVSAKDVPCRLSVMQLTNTTMEQNAANRLHMTHKLFAPADAPITGGSRLIVNGVKYVTTEEPMKYVTHIEVGVNRDEWL